MPKGYDPAGRSRYRGRRSGGFSRSRYDFERSSGQRRSRRGSSLTAVAYRAMQQSRRPR